MKMGIISDNFFSLNPIYQIMISFIDIVIVAILIYVILYIVKNNTKTLRIFKGTIIIIFIDMMARFFHFTALQTITQNLINWGFLVFIIIFQPEIRTLLERIGKSGLRRSSLVALDLSDNDIDQINDAVIELSHKKTGALITIERDVSLQDYINTGVLLDAYISKQLLLTIFKPNTALHDGAIIIRGNKIMCASTYYPPPSIDVLQSFGSRHRAAIGISEVSDSLTIVVSEETGRIRFVENGQATLVKADDFKAQFIERLVKGIDDNEGEVLNNA
jgi:uncharacterized protein (TIGR00159 family)